MVVALKLSLGGELPSDTSLSARFRFVIEPKQLDN